MHFYDEVNSSARDETNLVCVELAERHFYPRSRDLLILSEVERKNWVGGKIDWSQKFGPRNKILDEGERGWRLELTSSGGGVTAGIVQKKIILTYSLKSQPVLYPIEIDMPYEYLLELLLHANVS